MSLSRLAVTAATVAGPVWRRIRAVEVEGLELLIREADVYGDRGRDLRRALTSRVLGPLANVVTSTPSIVERYVDIRVFLDALDGWRGLTLPAGPDGAPDLTFRATEERAFDYSPALARDLFLAPAADGMLEFFDHDRGVMRRVKTPDGLAPRFATKAIFTLMFADVRGVFDAEFALLDGEDGAGKEPSSPGSSGDPGEPSATDAPSSAAAPEPATKASRKLVHRPRSPGISDS